MRATPSPSLSGTASAIENTVHFDSINCQRLSGESLLCPYTNQEWWLVWTAWSRGSSVRTTLPQCNCWAFLSLLNGRSLITYTPDLNIALSYWDHATLTISLKFPFNLSGVLESGSPTDEDFILLLPSCGWSTLLRSLGRSIHSTWF